MDDPWVRLRTKFIDRCRLERVALSAEWAKWKQPGVKSDDLVRLAHGLAGAGGTFGFPNLSRKAEAVETAILDERPDEEKERLIEELLVELELVVQNG